MTSDGKDHSRRLPGLPEGDTASFEQAAAQLLSAFKLSQDGAGSATHWQPDRPVVGEFTEKDVVGPLWRSEVDSSGRISALSISSKAATHTLDQDGLLLLENLAERWALHPSLAGLSTTTKMRERIQQWCWQVLDSGNHAASVDFVLSDLDANLRIHEIWIQVAGLDVEHQIPVGRIELRGVNSELVNVWARSMLEDEATPQKREHVKAMLAKEWQGHTAIVYRAYGDIAAVEAAAIEHAERTCSLLRVVDPRGSNPESRSFLQPLTLMSQANIRQTLIDPETTSASLSNLPNKLLAALPFTLTITRENLPAVWEEGGLRWVHELLAAHPPSQFQEHLLRSALIYSRQRLSADPIEKLIFGISALEAMLYAGDPDARQDTLKRRLCAVLAGSETFRDHVQQTVKVAYKLRKQFLHHGHSLSDLRAVEQFLTLAWLFFRRALSQHASWPTIESYCDGLDTTYRQRFESAAT